MGQGRLTHTVTHIILTSFSTFSRGKIEKCDLFREIKNGTVAYSVLPKQARYQLRYTRLLSFLSGWSYSPKPGAIPTSLYPDIQFLPLYHGGEENQSFFCLWSFMWSKPLLCHFQQPGEIPQTQVLQGFAAFRLALFRIPPLPKQARYQLRYTPIRYSLCIANPFLTALIVYWILAGKSTGRLHNPPE